MIFLTFNSLNVILVVDIFENFLNFLLIIFNKIILCQK